MTLKDYLHHCLDLAEKATPGPWIKNEYSMIENKQGDSLIEDVYPAQEFDCEFIAASREMVPILVKIALEFSVALEDIKEMQELCGGNSVLLDDVNEAIKRAEELIKEEK